MPRARYPIRQAIASLGNARYGVFRGVVLMARIRSIKPEFFTSEQLAECSTNARLLFVGLWCFCDDTGRHAASPKRLKMEVFPGDPFTTEEVAAMVAELIDNGLLVEYVTEGVAVWQVTGWHHQKIDRPQPAKYPELRDDSTIVRRSFDECAPNDRGGFDADRKGREGMGKDQLLSTEAVDGVEYSVGWVVGLWNERAKDCPILRAVRPPLSDDRARKVRTRLSTPWWPEAFVDALDKLPLPDPGGGTNWQPDLDWICKSDGNVQKILEGKYDWRSQVNRAKCRSALDD